MFLKDVPEALKEIVNLYADDITLHAVIPDLAFLEYKLNKGLTSLNEWLNNNRLISSTDNTVCMVLDTDMLQSMSARSIVNLVTKPFIR